MAGIRIPYTYTYQQYPFSPEATRYSKELAQRKAKRKSGMTRFAIILCGGMVTISLLAGILSAMGAPAIVELIMMPVVFVLWVIGYNAVAKIQDDSIEDMIDIALERDFKKIPEYSDNYNIARAVVLARRASKEQREAKSLKNRFKK
ncbi:MAG: hypothetical protein LUF29_05210 [Oscillospiraceae bacterium]|nr:hypothetical protein [Oscillospiraceae bacterium]